MDEKDKALISEIEIAKQKLKTLLEEYKFSDALFEVIDLARKGNKYMQEKEPWIKATPDSERSVLITASKHRNEIDNCLHICLQLCCQSCYFYQSFPPITAKKMMHMMKVVDKMLDWENAGKTKLLSVGYSLRAPELLFRKIEDAEVQHQVEKLKLKSSKKTDSIIMQNE